MLLSYKPLHLEAQQRLQEEGCVVDIRHLRCVPVDEAGAGGSGGGNIKNIPTGITRKLRMEERFSLHLSTALAGAAAAMTPALA